MSINSVNPDVRCHIQIIEKLLKPMKIYYDAEVDALYIEFHSLTDGTAEARPLNDEIIANYGPLVGTTPVA